VGRTFGFLSPTSWTTLSLLIAIAAFATAATGRLNLAVLLFVLSGACDVIDGRSRGTAAARPRSERSGTAPSTVSSTPS